MAKTLNSMIKTTANQRICFAAGLLFLLTLLLSLFTPAPAESNTVINYSQPLANVSLAARPVREQSHEDAVRWSENYRFLSAVRIENKSCIRNFPPWASPFDIVEPQNIAVLFQSDKIVFCNPFKNHYLHRLRQRILPTRAGPLV